MIEKFIVLAAHRSGNTLLLGSLDSHPYIRCHKRVFVIDAIVRRLFWVDRPGSPFHTFRTASVRRRIDYVLRKKQVIHDFLTEVYTPPNGVRSVGIRVIYEQADKHPQVLDWAAQNKVGIIHLIRENALKTLVSAETIRKRGLAHSTSKVATVTVGLSPFKLKMQLTRLTRQIEKFRAMLKETRHLEVSYEALATHREAEIGRVLDFLQIEPHGSLTTNLVKLNPNSLQDIIENYDEIQRSLNGTEFEKFLS